MPRYIVRKVGPGTEAGEMLKQLDAHPDVTLVDQDMPHMLLVDAPGAALENLVSKTPGWSISPEQSYAPPKPHQVEKPKPPPKKGQ
jgi:hypothetical protein